MMDPDKSIAIKREVFYEMIYHCMRERPLSARGMLVGRGAAVESLEKMASVEADREDATSETIAGMETKSRLIGRGLKPLAHFRCRSKGAAQPTDFDVETHSDPSLLLIIVLLEEDGVPMVKAYGIAGGKISSVRIDIE